MLRGFRWQFLALLLALLLFASSVIVRVQQTPLPTLSATPTPQPSQTGEPSPTVEIPVTPISALPQTAIDPYREALVGSVGRLNPLFADLNPVDADISALIFEGLTRTNDFGEPMPDLARTWVISSDGLEYVITLRDDVLWQDGTPFTSADVAYTMSLLRDPGFPGSAALGSFWRTVETEVLGTHLVRFRLTQPLGSFFDKLQIGILPEHALRGTRAAQLTSHPFNLTPIGTGPYQLEAIGLGPDGRPSEVVLRAAPVYRQRAEAQGLFSIERLRFQLYPTFDDALNALSSGQADGLSASTATERAQMFDLVSTRPDLALNTQLESTLGALIFNWESADAPFLREQRVRVALETGLDRSSIVERRLSNLAIEANSPIIPGSWAYLPNLPWPAYDPAAALNLLNTANQRAAPTPTPEATTDTPPNDGRIRFSLLVPNEPALVGLAEEVAVQWTQLNFEVNVESVDLETYRARLESGAFDVALVEYAFGTSADPDVYAFWHQGQTPPDGLNYGRANDGRVSEILERARTDASGINRIQLYHEFQQQFVERAIAIPLYYPLYTYVVSNRLSGMQLGFIGADSDRFRNIGMWQLNS